MNLDISNDEQIVLLRGLFLLEPNPSDLIRRLIDLRTGASRSVEVEASVPVHEKPLDRPAVPTPAPQSNILVNEPTKISPPASPTSESLSPLIEEVEVETEVGSGKNKRLELKKLMQCEGVIVSVSPVKKSQRGSDFIALVIAGLPDSPEHKTITPHSQFHCFHKSLFDALKTAKQNSRIVFHYEPTIKQDDPKKLVWQNLEDVCSVDGVVFLDGKAQ
jgi:hypothetical protein